MDPREQEKAAKVEALAGRLAGEMGTGAGAAVFVRELYGHAAVADVLGVADEDLLAAARALWAFAAERTPGAPRLRIYQPAAVSGGWNAPNVVIECINDDMPFIVDSVTQALKGLDVDPLLVLHPILSVERDDQGRLQRVGLVSDETVGGRAESWMHLRVRRLTHQRFGEVQARLEAVLADVRAAVEDWKAMRRRLRDQIREFDRDPPRIPKREIREVSAFLEWLDDDNFTFLGFREYSFKGEGTEAVAEIDTDSGLGLLRDPGVSVFDGLRNLGALPGDVQAWLRTPQLLRITKANRRSTVHRAVPLDAIALKTFNRKGEVVGERLFVGLFTNTAYARPPAAIPLLRSKVDHTLEKAGFLPESHNGKALQHILDTYPRDELFQIGEEELADVAIGILSLQERQRTALFVRVDRFERFVSCMLFVPRDTFDTALRLKLQSQLASAYGGRVASFTVLLGDSPLARLHIIIETVPGEIPDVDVAALERRLAETARDWSDRLVDALVERHGEDEGLRLARLYARAFSVSYRDKFTPMQAVGDIDNIEKVIATGEPAPDLHRPPGVDSPEVLHFKLFAQGDPLPLSDVLPRLENFGLRVISENGPHWIERSDSDRPVVMHDFDLRLPAGATVDLAKVRDKVHQAALALWHRTIEDDRLNSLVLLSGLTAREVSILRAYAKYLRQLGIPFAQDYVEQTLVRNSAIAGDIVRLFLARFDPARAPDPTAQTSATADLEQAVVRALDGVSNLDEDRIIRRFLNLVMATVRTNYFQCAADGGPKDRLSFKFDAHRVEEMPAPRPYREIFVYSPRVKGVHLRFGPVARGGLRWSDRRDDFRTEILGLVKAQQVKNAVIVPVGAKGGFYPENLPPPEAGRDAVMAEAVECYRTFVRGLLDITDNLRGHELLPPPDVERYDNDDPYLVVAADKGTATFSDYANALSQEYGFWLGDAFASGGSAGYDHKAMGITARGAWESGKRHFRELGTDIQSQDFTVIGVGDMSGDVFGNGMLLSRHIRLIGAFNHLHIFFDPDPDPEASWRERQRLFALPRSSWKDYDPALISEGGGVFDRRAKSIPVTAPMRRLFNLTTDHIAPNDLIRQMLRTPVDLLWFGGIGTYVKASGESHAEVGDRTNDALRIDGRQLRAKVVGEGANLGMTQRARIEYAAGGGRLNTDAIDNSAGVDCSDHEVNIKILLGAVEEAGELDRPARDRLLAEMTDEVAALVLRDNYLQTQSISVTQQLGGHLLDRFGRFMRTLEKAGRLDRSLEFLPDDEILTDRAKAGDGLTRPELSVLLAYAKISLFEDVVSSDLPDDPAFAEDLHDYFPTPLRERFGRWIESHRLRRQIIATVGVNEVVNRMGIVFVHEIVERTAIAPAEVIRCYLAARSILRLKEVWAEIEALDNRVPATVQYRLLAECGRLCERLTVWLARNENLPLSVGATVDAYCDDLAAVAAVLPDKLHPLELQKLEQAAADYAEAGVPEELARRIAAYPFLVPVGDIVKLARGGGIAVADAAEVFFDVGGGFGFDWLHQAAGRLPSETAWAKLAVTALVDDLYGHQRALAAGVVEQAGRDQEDWGQALRDWVNARQVQVGRTDQLMAELQTFASPDLSMLSVANRRLKDLAGLA